MFCPECGAEYRQGFWKCGDCDVMLVATLEAAAIDRQLVPLTEDRRFDFVADLLDRLEKEGVPYVIEAGTALPLLDDQPLPNPDRLEWEARVYVAHGGSKRANEILEDLRQEMRLAAVRRPIAD